VWFASFAVRGLVREFVVRSVVREFAVRGLVREFVVRSVVREFAEPNSRPEPDAEPPNRTPNP